MQQEQQPAVMAFKPMKPRPFGHTKSVVSEAFDQAGGVPAIAAFLERGVSTVYGYGDESAATTHLSLDQARRLTKFQNVTAFAEDMAALAGGIFVPLASQDNAEILSLCSEAQLCSGTFWAEVFAALEDGEISQPEAEKIRPLLPSLIRAMVALQVNLGRIADGRM